MKEEYTKLKSEVDKQRNDEMISRLTAKLAESDTVIEQPTDENKLKANGKKPKGKKPIPKPKGMKPKGKDPPTARYK